MSEWALVRNRGFITGDFPDDEAAEEGVAQELKGCCPFCEASVCCGLLGLFEEVHGWLCDCSETREVDVI